MSILKKSVHIFKMSMHFYTSMNLIVLCFCHTDPEESLNLVLWYFGFALMTNYKSILICFTVWYILTPHVHSLVKNKEKVLFLVNKYKKLLIFQQPFPQIYQVISLHIKQKLKCVLLLFLWKFRRTSIESKNQKNPLISSNFLLLISW